MIEDLYKHILAKSRKSGEISLMQHLSEVSKASVLIAEHLGYDVDIARKGAILHDIGKASPLFQQTLEENFDRKTVSPNFIFRHEIASLFFLSLFNNEEKPILIEMIVSHHKSLVDDKGRGFLDLYDNMEDCFKVHSKDFDIWSVDALAILNLLGISTHPISLEEAERNYLEAVDYCERIDVGISDWKGILMAADHLVSAMEGRSVDSVLSKLFISPDLSFYNSRYNKLYPLSTISNVNERIHTIVIAPTGAGKTDFLLRRCKNRVFYVLPYQASINAMYDRISGDLKDTDAVVSLLHSTSVLKLENNDKNEVEEAIYQRHLGASVKILTPHQLTGLVFGIKGYEALKIDLQDCDVILDEIHTYSNVMQSVVLKMIEILNGIGCRLHIGSATMPTSLYRCILNILGGKDSVYEVHLDDDTLQSFNRHIINKIKSNEEYDEIIQYSVISNKKLLIVCNQIKKAQQLYIDLKAKYKNIPILLIHSRFKRNRRQELELLLKNSYNNMNKGCIVVSTQVVEVSLDINFDVMITECAPLDSMIQRFGRINRKRSIDSIGVLKPIYILKPPKNKNEARPYDLEILNCSYDVLYEGELQEKDIQNMLDMVYPSVDVDKIDSLGVAFMNGDWCLRKLYHRGKSALLDVLNIDSIPCVTESDENKYWQLSRSQRIGLEISIPFNSIYFSSMHYRNGIYIVPDNSYDNDMGLFLEKINLDNYKSFEFL